MTNEHLWWHLVTYLEALYLGTSTTILPSCRTGAVCPMCVDLAYGSGGSGSPTRVGVEKLKVIYHWTVLFHFFALKQYPLTDLRVSVFENIVVLFAFFSELRNSRPAPFWKPKLPSWFLCGFSAIFQQWISRSRCGEFGIRGRGRSFTKRSSCWDALVAWWDQLLPFNCIECLWPMHQWWQPPVVHRRWGSDDQLEEKNETELICDWCLKKIYRHTYDICIYI